MALLAFGILVDLLAVWSGVRQHTLLTEIAAGESVADAEIDANDRRYAAIGGAQAIVLTLTAAAFLAWFFRAYANLPTLGAEPRFGRRWAVGAWFVPILNLWRPKQIANDIWRASDPEAEREQATLWRDKRVPVLFMFWWLAFLVSEQLYRLVFRRAVRDETPDEIASSTALTVLADLVSAVAGALAIAVVLRTTNRQEGRATRLGLPAREIDTPLYRRPVAWATVAAILVALAAQGGLALLVWNAANEAPAAQQARPAGDPDDPGLLLRDDFSDETSGWPIDRAAAAGLEYASGAYRIEIMRKNYDQHVFRSVQPEDGMEIQVAGTLRSTSPADGFGAGCWVGSEDGYFGIVYADGFYLIAKDPPETNESIALARGKDRKGNILGPGKKNLLRFECAREATRARLALWVNGERLATARDPETLPRFTAVGMLASSVTGRTDVRFDDLEARRLDPE